MDAPELGQVSTENQNVLNRSRSLKSKQLVRSQAIREAQSPPRTITPRPEGAQQSEDKDSTNEYKDGHQCPAQTPCARSNRRHLSNTPRLTCVCCPDNENRTKKRDLSCPTKQDSGIICSEDCTECEDNGTSTLSVTSVESVGHEENVCRCHERKEKTKYMLQRTDSDDKTDLSGVELVNFVKATLNKNPRDRMDMLKIEKELHSLVTDPGRCIIRFPAMTSYGRMLVHRCAALFQLSHHLDIHNKACVVVSKSGTSGGSIPCTSFKQWCTTIFPSSLQQDATQAKFILKRSSHSLDSGCAVSSGPSSKSLQQREKDYETLRTRIFSTENCSHDDGEWPWNSAPVKLLTPDAGKKLLKVQSLEGNPTNSTNKGSVAKSHSFGGYGDSTPTHRMLSRQGDLASSSWRLSSSSSGYKTLSLRSTESVTPSPTSCVTPEPNAGHLLWAVTDLSSVPTGALIIHPQTGRPLTNSDGSLYHYDPNNPPVLYSEMEPKMEENNEKRRGRLEKQNSFIENEPDQYRDVELCSAKNNIYGYANELCKENTVKKNSQDASKHSSIHSSPSKRAYDVTNGSANQMQGFDLMAPINQDINEINRLQTFDTTIKNPSKNEQQFYSNASYVPGYATTEAESPCSVLINNFDQSNMAPKNATPTPTQTQISSIPMPGMLYGAVPPPYAYSNQHRMDPQYPPPLCTPIASSVEEQQKQIHEPTFRIDASYPYAPIEPYVSQCTAACETPHANVGMYPMDGSVYPMSNVIMPQQYHLPQYQQMSWPVAPMMQTPPVHKSNSPTVYIQPEYSYNQMYPYIQYPYNYQYVPQVMPSYLYDKSVYEKSQQNLYEKPVKYEKPVSYEKPVNRIEKTNSFEKPSYEKYNSKTGLLDQSSYFDQTAEPKIENKEPSELSQQIQQIKNQISLLSTHEKKDKNRTPNTTSLLGKYPSAPQIRPNSRPINDETQLSSAARAIVNSIRGMQSKNNLQDPPRREIPRDVKYQREEDRDRRDKRYEHFRNRSSHYGYRQTNNVFRQMAPGTWCRRPTPQVAPGMNTPRRPPPPDSRNRY